MKKTIWIIVGLVILVFIIVLLGPNNEANETHTPTETDLSYEEALNQYGNDRIQFDAACQATPQTITVKSGTTMMFDNRSGDARWIALNGSAYEIQGHDYLALTLSNKTLPHEIFIDCGSGKNVGTILLQK